MELCLIASFLLTASNLLVPTVMATYVSLGMDRVSDTVG